MYTDDFTFKSPPPDIRLSLRRALDTISTCTPSNPTQSEPIDTPEREETLEEVLRRWQTDLVRVGQVPMYLVHVLPSLQAVKETKDQRCSDAVAYIQEHGFSLHQELQKSCLNAGCRIFLSSCRRQREPALDLEETSSAHEGGSESEDSTEIPTDDENSDLYSDFDVHGDFVEESQLSRAPARSYDDGRIQDLEGRYLPHGLIKAGLDDMIHGDPFSMYPRGEAVHLVLAFIVPDMYELMLDKLEDPTCSIGDLIGYLKSLVLGPQRSIRPGDIHLLNTVLSKVIEGEETRIRRAKRHRVGCGAAIYNRDTLVPAMVACQETGHDFLLSKALRCLRGAPISIFSELFEISPSFPYNLIETE
jgi:hypothetical protein